MAKVEVYEHSKFATFLSALGWIGIGFGFYACFNEGFGWEIGIISFAISFGLKILAFLLNKFVGLIKSKWAVKKNKINK